MWGLSGKAAVCKLGRQPSPNHAGSLISVFPASKTERMNFWCLNHLVYSISLWQPEQTNTLSTTSITLCLWDVNPWGWSVFKTRGMRHHLLMGSIAKNLWTCHSDIILHFLVLTPSFYSLHLGLYLIWSLPVSLFGSFVVFICSSSTPQFLFLWLNIW